jgi:hypothetical protein
MGGGGCGDVDFGLPLGGKTGGTNRMEHCNVRT